MLVVVGVTFLVIGTIVTVVAAMVYQDRIGSTAVRKMVSSPVLCVFLATCVGCGLMILFLFIVEFETQSFGMAEALLSAAIAAVGAFGVRRLARRHHAHQDHDHLPSGHPA